MKILRGLFSLLVGGNVRRYSKESLTLSVTCDKCTARSSLHSKLRVLTSMLLVIINELVM